MINRLDLIKEQLESKGLIIKEILKINQGKNSSSFKISTVDKIFALKIYPKNTVNNRNRIKSELDFLLFLKENKFDKVPKPILWDKKNKWILLSWLDGSKILSPTKEQCELLIAFLKDIQIYKKSKLANNIKNASEACFTLDEHINHLKSRIKFLLDYLKDSSGVNKNNFAEIINFIEEFNNKIKIIEQKDLKSINTKMIVEKILSPSDIGFHNTLMDQNIMKFIDFEYAGWDDPTKMISDLILQPDYNIPIEHITVLNSLINEKFLPNDFKIRIPIMLKLYRIKWIIIMLNPLLKSGIIFSKEEIDLKNKRLISYANDSDRRIVESLTKLF